jgi:hypothetical protein
MIVIANFFSLKMFDIVRHPTTGYEATEGE